MRIPSIAVLGCLLFTGLPILNAQQGMCPSVMIDQRLEPATASVIQGTVQNPNGQSVKGVFLTLAEQEKPKPKFMQVVSTDDKGQFHFDSVPAGKYDITIHWTSKTAKHTQVQCDANGVCQVAFTLNPPKKVVPCSTDIDDNIRASRMSGIQ